MSLFPKFFKKTPKEDTWLRKYVDTWVPDSPVSQKPSQEPLPPIPLANPQASPQTHAFHEAHSPEKQENFSESRIDPLTEAPSTPSSTPILCSEKISSSALYSIYRIELKHQTIEYQLHRKKRKTLSLQIDGAGLKISAPTWISIAQIDAFIGEKQAWITKKLHENKRRQHALPQVTHWEHGSPLYFLGEAGELHLHLHEDKQAKPCCTWNDDDATLHLRLAKSVLSQKVLTQTLYQFYTLQAQTYFAQRLDYFASLMQLNYASFSLSNAKTTWGTCNARRDIKLNWRLILLSPHLIDYVVVHELAHLVHLNHSPAFWALVSSVMPDHKSHRKDLHQFHLKHFPI